MSEDLFARLAAPFHEDEIKWKAQVVKGNRAMPVCYVDARVIQARLDDVLTPAGWKDQYEVLTSGSVVCSLSLKLAGEWITKMDVGSPSEQPDEGDRLKSAFSDALKRAAVKFGLGRYLYEISPQWCDYDPVKKQFVERPRLPAWARPNAEPPKAEKPKTLEEYVAKHGVEATWKHLTTMLVERGVPIERIERYAGLAKGASATIPILKTLRTEFDRLVNGTPPEQVCVPSQPSANKSLPAPPPRTPKPTNPTDTVKQLKKMLTALIRDNDIEENTFLESWIRKFGDTTVWSESNYREVIEAVLNFAGKKSST